MERANEIMLHEQSLNNWWR